MIQLILLITILASIYATYTDIRYKRISNYLTGSMFLLGCIYHSYLSLQYIINISSFLTNVGLAILVGFLMYFSGLWSPGDSKLFIAVSSLIPINYYNYFIYINFPSLSIFINSFVPAFFTLALFLLFKTTLKQKKESLRNILDLKFLFSFFVIFFIFFNAGNLIVDYFFSMTNIAQNYFLAIIFYIFVYYLIKTYLGKQYQFLIYGVLFILSCWYVLTESYSFKYFIITFLSFLFLRFFFLDLSRFVLLKEVKIHELKEGQVSAEVVFKVDNGYMKKPVNYFSLVSLSVDNLNGEIVVENEPEGLSKEDIKVLKDLSKKGCVKSLLIQRSFPFAIFILIGLIITVVLKGNFIIFLLLL